VRGDGHVTLEAVVDAALRAAREEAGAIRRGAERRAAEVLADARSEAARIVERRGLAAERLAQEERRERLAEARAQARAIVLGAQRSVLDDAAAEARAAAGALARDPAYRRLQDALAAEAKRRLRGADTVELVPAPHGGFVARAGNRQIDYSLDAQIARSLEAASAEREPLWR
jgi:vacuolar-type H+-ATPase subunit E/Vma4